ncbi:MAG: hypothetical protein HY978_03550 [Candidatus Liptonbacteria bacterium]|nr:hypothetical protein [Candidatus Liptonbacteria bacterium]
MSTILVKTISMGVASLALISPSFINPQFSSNTPSAVASQADFSQPTPTTQPDALDVWLERLAELESHGKAQLKIVDHNGWHSYSCLQFQMPTFKEYVVKYNLLPEAEEPELENMIYDCDFQKQLAKKMLLDDPSNWQHWYFSVIEKGLGLPPIHLAEK